MGLRKPPKGKPKHLYIRNHDALGSRATGRLVVGEGGDNKEQTHIVW